MIRLHLVGLTTDLKNLIFAEQRGARSGGFVVSLDARLKRTLEEVARLEEQPDEAEEMRSLQSERTERSEQAAAYETYPEEPEQDHDDIEEAAPPAEPPRPRVASKLTPKEIQSLLRRGKTEQEVAQLAGTDLDWIQRFSFAILSERAGVIDAVQSASLTKPRLGISAKSIGESVRDNLDAKRVSMSPDDIDAAWKAVRTNGLWQVSFEYTSRGQTKTAEFSYDPATRTVEPLNEVAMEIGWRSGQPPKAAGPKVAASTTQVVSGVSPRTARTANASRTSAAKRRPGKPRPGATEARRPPTRGAGAQAGAVRPQAEPDLDLGAGPRRPLNHSPDLGSQVDVGGGEEDDEFIIRKPRNPSGDYSSLPKVWRPRRRV